MSYNFNKCYIKSDATLGCIKSGTIRVHFINLAVNKKELFSSGSFVEGVIFVWGIFNLQEYCCNLFCTRPLHKGKQGCTSLHFWVSRIYQWCSTWSIRHCMTSYHNRQGKHWLGFLRLGPTSTNHPQRTGELSWCLCSCDQKLEWSKMINVIRSINLTWDSSLFFPYESYKHSTPKQCPSILKYLTYMFVTCLQSVVWFGSGNICSPATD